jgi:hypothetical protein
MERALPEPTSRLPETMAATVAGPFDVVTISTSSPCFLKKPSSAA